MSKLRTTPRGATAIRRALRPFRSPEALVAGEISYWTETATGRTAHRTVTFKVPVLLYVPRASERSFPRRDARTTTCA